MRKSAGILAGLFVLFLIIGIWVNTQEGLRLSGDFWKAVGANEYVSSGGCRLVCGENGAFVFQAEDWEAAILASQAENGMRFDFPDGTAVIREEEIFPLMSVEIDGVVFAFGEKVILTDIRGTGYRYTPEIRMETEYFYREENETPVGEMWMLLSADGSIIDSGEYFYESGEERPEKEQITLENGMVLLNGEMQEVLYRNPEGEYLVNADELFGFWLPTERMRISKQVIADFLTRAASGETERRGELFVVFLYALCYLIGACSWLWPDKMAFLGSRWKYREEPELSDEGLFMAKVGAVFAMGMGVFMLFAPLGGI